MRSFGTNEYGNKDGFSIKCNKCGKDGWIVPVHHYDEKHNLTGITLDIRCSCSNRFGATIHGDINLYDEDEVKYKLILEDSSIIYLKMWFSANPPADKNNPGCIGISVMDHDLNEIDGGELDYTNPNVKLIDMLSDCIDFMNLKVDKTDLFYRCI